MLALVLFDDGVYYICKKTDIIDKGVECSIRYKDRRRYAGKVIAYNENKQELIARMTELEKEEDSEFEDEKSIENKIVASENEKVESPADNKEDEIPASNVEENVPIVLVEKKDRSGGEEIPIENAKENQISAPENEKEESLAENKDDEIPASESEENVPSVLVEKKDQSGGEEIPIEKARESPISAAENEKEESLAENKDDEIPASKGKIVVVSVEAFPLVDVSPSNSGHSDSLLIEPGDLSTALNNNISWDWGEYQLNVYDQMPLVTTDELNINLRPDPKIYDPTTSNKSPDNYTAPGTLDISVDEEAALSDNRESSSNGSSYAPESDASDDSFENRQDRDVSAVDKLKNSTTTCNSSMDLDASVHINKVGHSAPDDAKMTVKAAEDGIKKDWCVYCDTEQGKLSRHVVRKHRGEEDVAKFLSYEVGSKERKIVMDMIRKRGQFRFNTNRAVNTGERKVIRRPNAKYHKAATDFATCPSCFGDYAKTSLRHHYRRCKTKTSGNHRSILLQSKKITGRIHPKACDLLRTRIFPSLQEDDVTKAVRYDELIILFGNKLCQKYQDPHFYDMVRQKLRQLGRLLLEIRRHDSNINEFFDIYFPKNYDNTITAIKSLAGVNATGTGYKVPSLAASIGTLLKQVGRLCVSIWIKRQQKEKQVLTEDYLKLFIEDYPSSVMRTAIETQAQKKRQTKVVLPSTSDIQKLQGYLRRQLQRNFTILEEEFTYEAWLNLAETALISIQLFNRRRAGELERILIDDFLGYETIQQASIGEAYATFTREEKNAAENYVRFTIRGKLGRTVPVLIHREILASLQLILKFRQQAKVHGKNPYLFGIAGVLKGDWKYLRACELMRKFSEKCGAANPTTLRGTILRKHVATMCVNFNMTDDEVSDLANFLGHADKIHKEHYRQPIINREIIKMSKILEVVQGNDDSEEDSDNDDEVYDETGIGASNTISVNNSVSIEQHTENDRQVDSFLESNEAEDNTFAELHTKKQRKKRSTSPFGKCSRVRWSAKEIEVATEAFKDYFTPGTKLPGYDVIENVVAANPGLFSRNYATIKTWVSNQRKKLHPNVPS